MYSEIRSAGLGCGVLVELRHRRVDGATGWRGTDNGLATRQATGGEVLSRGVRAVRWEVRLDYIQTLGSKLGCWENIHGTAWLRGLVGGTCVTGFLPRIHFKAVQSSKSLALLCFVGYLRWM
jgi:hypothetical protein